MIKAPSPLGRAVNSRNQSLDVLRGIAVLLVIGHHNVYYKLWCRGGGVGVDLFFVLSGFLISGLLFSEYQRTGRIDVSRFLIRRGLKIYPAYYFFLLSLLPLTLHRVRFSDFTFMGAYFPPFWGHCWSLSVEEHFYLLLPIVLMVSYGFFRSRDFSWVPWAMPLLCAVCLCSRYRFSLLHPVVYGINATHLRIDALFAGVTLGWFQNFHPEQLRVRFSPSLALIGLVLVLPNFLSLNPAVMASAGSLANILGFSLILIWSLNSSSLRKLKPLARIGFYSYSIYLWHWPIALVCQLIPRQGFLVFWTYVLACLGVGILMSKAIEAPFLHLRDKMWPSVKIIRSQIRDPFSAPQVGRHAATRPAFP